LLMSKFITNKDKLLKEERQFSKDNNTDLTFITNEGERSLLERFKVLIKDTEFFDVLVGYFYTSGFYAIYKSLEKTKKIRILIGISTNRQTLELINKSKEEQLELQFSHAEVKQKFEDTVAAEVEQSQDKHYVEEGIIKFIEWLKKGKLEIRAYPTENIHAKLYIMTFAKGIGMLAELLLDQVILLFRG